jgi:hypothetical protein
MNEKHAVVYSGDDGAMQKCAMLVDGVPTGGFYATNMRDTYLSSNARVYFAVSKDDFELITKYLEQAGKSATETRSLDEWGVILRAAVFNTHTQFLRDVSTETTLRIAGNLDAGVQPTIISAQSDDVQPLQAPDGAYVFLNVCASAIADQNNPTSGLLKLPDWRTIQKYVSAIRCLQRLHVIALCRDNSRLDTSVQIASDAQRGFCAHITQELCMGVEYRCP